MLLKPCEGNPLDNLPLAVGLNLLGLLPLQYSLQAVGVGDGRIALSRLENGFLVRDFLPNPSGLKDGIAWADFVQSYGFPPDARLTRERESLRGQILAMPGYRIPPKQPILRDRSAL